MSGIGVFSLGDFLPWPVFAEIRRALNNGFCESEFCRSVQSVVGVGSIVSTAENLNRYPSPSQRFGLIQAGPPVFSGAWVRLNAAPFSAQFSTVWQKAFALRRTVLKSVSVLSDLRGVLSCLRKSGSGPLPASSHCLPAATPSVSRRFLVPVLVRWAVGLSAILSPVLSSVLASTSTVRAIPTPADPEGFASTESILSLKQRSSGKCPVAVFYFGSVRTGRVPG